MLNDGQSEHHQNLHGANSYLVLIHRLHWVNRFWPTLHMAYYANSMEIGTILKSMKNRAHAFFYMVHARICIQHPTALNLLACEILEVEFHIHAIR